MQPSVELHLARHRIMVFDQRLRVIDQNFHRNTPKPQECAFHPFEPVGLALPRRGSNVHPAGIAKRSDKHMDPHPLAADPDTRIAEVDLHLMTRRRLEADRRPLLRFQLASPLSNSKLHGTQPNDDAMLARQFLANDIGIAVVAEKALPKPIIQTVKRCSTSRLAIRHHTTFTKVATNRIACAAELLRNPFRSPANLMQSNHR